MFCWLKYHSSKERWGVVYLLCIWHMFCCRLTCHDILEIPRYHRGVGGTVFALYLAHVLLSACFRRQWKYPGTTGGVGGSVFALYLAHVLLSTYLPRHSGNTTVPQGGGGYCICFVFGTCSAVGLLATTVEIPRYHRGVGGVVYLLCIWHMFCSRLTCHDTLEVPHLTLPPSRGGILWTSNSAPYIFT